MTGCAKEETEMTNEQKEVLKTFETMQQAMIDKNLDTLYSIVTEDKTFTHMSGKKQTKEEFFGEIEDGTLNYYKYQIKNLNIAVDGDHATLNADVTLTAKVYGMSGSWTLGTHQNFIKIDQEWKICN